MAQKQNTQTAPSVPETSGRAAAVRQGGQDPDLVGEGKPALGALRQMFRQCSPSRQLCGGRWLPPSACRSREATFSSFSRHDGLIPILQMRSLRQSWLKWLQAQVISPTARQWQIQEGGQHPK